MSPTDASPQQPGQDSKKALQHSPVIKQNSCSRQQVDLKSVENVTSNETNADTLPRTPAPVPYSVFTRWQKLYLTYLLGFLTLASSLTANIYLPLILLLAEQYHTSAQAINLTITVYVIFQGISASFWSPLSDVFGRRPVFILTFGLYTAASLGLALSQGSYTALILLRATQSVGGSAVLSLAYGVVADLVTSAERGSMLGPMLASGNLGPCIGPIIGGGVVMTGQPAWCFWALVIFGGIALMLILWTMPETRRTIVGNGSVPALGIWRTWWSLLVDWRRSKTPEAEEDSEKGNNVHLSAGGSFEDTTLGDKTSKKIQEDISNGVVTEDPNKNATGKGRLIVPNPFISLRLVFYWDTFLGLWLAASPYAVWYLIQASIPVIYGKDPGGYGFKDIYVGLCYLTGGSGVIAGGFICGKMMDRNYKHVAKRAGFSTDKSDNHNIHDFPIEEARSRFSLLILAFSACVLVGFAWAVQLRVHPAVPLILQFYLGAKCTVLHQKPSTIAASNNIIRCGLSAAVVAALNPLVSAMGRGWFFTMVAFLDGGLCMVFVVILRRWGKHWRNKRNKNKTICSRADRSPGCDHGVLRLGISCSSLLTPATAKSSDQATGHAKEITGANVAQGSKRLKGKDRKAAKQQAEADRVITASNRKNDDNEEEIVYSALEIMSQATLISTYISTSPSTVSRPPPSV
ncbi:hypothetical protein KVR01_009149 [Diaporthe batatas]|uniref:uncharacterized protein n=1 Tax=Diaporthe batatas TaxID=748121 RepID=UPI001D059C08|nr:uncharacterized protein KVR01_009149 [Diaporthe batatas]KAG8160885.1 hypothetical protein KVR01_009149 [Diaporthe batatas]